MDTNHLRQKQFKKISKLLKNLILTPILYNKQLAIFEKTFKPLLKISSEAEMIIYQKKLDKDDIEKAKKLSQETTLSYIDALYEISYQKYVKGDVL